MIDVGGDDDDDDDDDVYTRTADEVFRVNPHHGAVDDARASRSSGASRETLVSRRCGYLFQSTSSFVRSFIAVASILRRRRSNETDAWKMCVFWGSRAIPRIISNDASVPSHTVHAIRRSIVDECFRFVSFLFLSSRTQSRAHAHGVIAFGCRSTPTPSTRNL